MGLLYLFADKECQSSVCLSHVALCICRCSRYPAVKSDSERHRYKADFMSEYSEYLRLHGSISQRMKTFNYLSDRLKQAAKHSSDYEVCVGQRVFLTCL